ncbi:MAG: CHAT domain-containing protein [Potamolinea sp.]
MKFARLRFGLLFSSVSLTGAISWDIVALQFTSPVLAQSLNRANDGTGTQVIQQGNQFDITGGKLSKDGANLFHSFQQFGLSESQIANFLSLPSTQNILGRVVGNNPSLINGLIQVSGSKANLYLMNPAGIVFGPNASLNVPASFTATTATGIALKDNNGVINWFNSFAGNNYKELVGNPSQFAFDLNPAGSIINAGNLNVKAGENLTLVGGNVINTGKITTPGGNITLAAIPGTSLVKLSHAGNVLALEIAPPRDTQGQFLPLKPLDLAGLLTGSGRSVDTGLAVSPTQSVQLTSSGTAIPTDGRTVIVSGTVDVSNTNPLLLPLSQGGRTANSQIGGSVNILGDKVGVINGNINASGTNGGGTVLIGGDYRGQGTVPNASRTFVSSDSTINADAKVSGDGGRVILWSDQVTGFYGKISARGGSSFGNGGFVELSSKNDLAFKGQVNVGATNGVDGTILFDPTNITIVAATAVNDNQLNANVPNPGDLAGTILSGDGGAVDFTISKVALEAQTGNIVLEATNNITIAPGVSLNFLNAVPRSITFTADADKNGVGSFSMDTTQSIFAGSRQGVSVGGNNITISGSSVTVGSLDTTGLGIAGGAINITATNGNIITGALASSSAPPGPAGAGSGGAITLSAAQGNITIAGNLNSSTGNRGGTGNGGKIAISAANDITITGNVSTSYNSRDTAGNGGAIILTTTNGNIITTGSFDSSSSQSFGLTGNGGLITLSAVSGIIRTGNLNSSSTNVTNNAGNGGEISLSASNGITTGVINSSTRPPSNTNFAVTGISGGTVTLNAGTSNITLGGNIDTSAIGGIGGSINFTGNLTLTQPTTTITSTGTPNSGSITFNNPLNGTTLGSQSLTLTSGNGILTFNGIGNSVPLGVLTLNGTGNVQLAGDYNFTNSFTFNNPVTLIGNTQIASGNTLAFGNTLSAGANNLTLIANEINFTRVVSGTGDLIIQPFSVGQAIAIGGTTDTGTATLDLLATEMTGLQNGFKSITIGSATGTGTISLTSNTTFNDPVTLLTGDGSINTTGGIITGADDATITLQANQNITTGSIINPGRAVTLTSINGNINTSAGPINTDSTTGNGGAIALTAKGGIITSSLDSRSSAPSSSGGKITLDAGGNVSVPSIITIWQGSTTGDGGEIVVSAGGNILSQGDFLSFTSNGRGGNITFKAGGNIFTDDIYSIGSLSSGDIKLTSGDTINTTLADSTPGNILSCSGTGNTCSGGNSKGGNVTLEATTRIVTEINATGPLGGGNISVTSNEIDLKSSRSNGGTLLLGPFTANQNIEIGGTGNTNALDLTAAEITALGDGFSSIQIGRSDSSGTITILNGVTFKDPVTIQAPVGSGAIVATGEITGTDNASITLLANNNITAGNIKANAGISITSSNGTINTSTGILDTSSITGNGGAINLTAFGNITSGNLNSSASGTESNGGKIAVTSNTGSITTGNLNSSGTNNGGDIIFDAKTQITAGQINSSGTTGKGGNVTLDPEGDIQVTWINSQGGTSGGKVNITTERFFRATGTFDQNGVATSISTAGNSGSGDITIRHGGNGITPFKVGDGSINGTLGAINSGSVNIAPNQSFPFSYKQGKIEIITNGIPINLVDINQAPVIKNGSLANPVDINQPSVIKVDLSTNSTTVNQSATSKDNPPSSNIFILGERSPRNSGYNTTNLLSRQEIEAKIAKIETSFTNTFENHLGVSNTPTVTLPQTQATLQQIEQATGVKPAIIYVSFSNQQLELLLVTSSGEPIQQRVEGTTPSKVLSMVTKLQSEITNPLRRNSTSYLAPSKQLYQWLVAPLEKDLQAQKIQNLVFVIDKGLRSIPLAALHDGKAFIVERYSVGLMPSISLTDTRYVDVRNSQVLAMGASKFTDNKPLPAVPVELSTITTKLWQGKSFLNENFTLENLKSARAEKPYGIIHLATHADFQAGQLSNSNIYLWNSKLSLDKLRELSLSKPPVELFILSACRTALGDEGAELGFAGLAVQAGVKSALGSLWSVSDEGTLGLMTQFYQQLKQSPIKAEALRRAQLAMLKGEVRLQGGNLVTSNASFPLPPELVQMGNKNLSHPYYWSAFTMIGNPW